MAQKTPNTTSEKFTTAHGGDVRVKTNNGEIYIAATQRPDGTWRKARRVKAGYIPQDEQPRFECRAQTELRQQSNKPTGSSYPVGWCPIEMVKSAKKIPPSAADKTGKPSGSSKPMVAVDKPNAPITPEDHLQKQIGRLKKKIEEIDKLDEKIKSGELKTPEKTQLDKIARKHEIEEEIEELSKKLNEL